MRIIIVEEAGERLDAYIHAKVPELSRTMIQKLLEQGSIVINEKNEKASYRVKKEDRIRIEEIEPKEVDLKPQEIPLEVLYEDSDLLVINKAKGMVVHPGNGNLEGTLVNAVMAYCKESLSGIGGEIRPRYCTSIG